MQADKELTGQENGTSAGFPTAKDPLESGDVRRKCRNEQTSRNDVNSLRVPLPASQVNARPYSARQGA
eukprot:3318605-Heterocapsa_arctica.AAC.1